PSARPPAGRIGRPCPADGRRRAGYPRGGNRPRQTLAAYGTLRRNPSLLPAGRPEARFPASPAASAQSKVTEGHRTSPNATEGEVEGAGMTSEVQQSGGVEALREYPLLHALAYRRSRRFSAGATIGGGGLKHESALPPA